ncbi:MAG TPA: hypothetical protein VGI65_16690 [Steroidobacteraceae bacterium]|jgi:hypothetical protein
MRITRSAVHIAALMLVGSICAAAPVETLRSDLRPLIKAAADSPVQFAVHVPHSVSTQANGRWTSKTPASAEWSYTVRIPSAVSMSFHATRIRLPASAVFTVQGAITTVVYRAADIKKSDLWSRVLPGESLSLTIDVANAQRSDVVLDIQSFQAGYRALGGVAKDHPYYRQLLRQSDASDNSSCVQNYECSVAPANTPIAKATVGILVDNLYQCTGTLINDVPGDNAPYVLTARHCENGTYGGGAPGNAANVTVYWNAVTACGSSLGSIYDPAIVTQSGATTIIEQQDAWLIKLDDSPAATDAQFAGFDASGVAVQGGYSIHHALGNNDQLTQWFGQAYPLQQSDVLGSTFLSNFLETVNQAGNLGPGASGSGLIDANNRLVGALSLGRKSSDPSGYESCPLVTPPAPNGSNGTADFTALASVWSSTADTTTTTGTATLKSVLDPANSGTQIVSSAPAINLNFTPSSYSLSDGNTLTLSWNPAGATSCTAGGGANGDGWSGALPASGTQTLTETFGGSVKYSLTCQFGAGRQITSSVAVAWSGTPPNVVLESFPFRWVNSDAVLTWNSNVSPCAITGGGVALSGLPSSGTTAATQSSAGDATYNISCGSAPAATAITTVSFVTPALAFRATGTDRLIGQQFGLYWQSYADTCIPSGGAPNDGWTTNALAPAYDFNPTVRAAGTYTYTLTCSSGPNQLTQSVTVTLENNAPYTTLSITPTTVTYSANPAADYVTISWKSNMSLCTLNSSAFNVQQQFSSGLPAGAGDAEDSGPFVPIGIGDTVVTMTCATGAGYVSNSATSPPITLHVLPPPAPSVSVSTSASAVTVGQPFTVDWTSANAQNCVASNNEETAGVVWWGPVLVSGSQTIGSDTLGQLTLSITCQSIDPNQAPATAQVQVTINPVPAPSASLSVSPTSVAIGQSYTLTWSSTNATACTPGGGGANGAPWTSSTATSGTLNQTATVAGTFTFTISCSSSNSVGQSQATLTVTAAASSGGSGSGKSGGGSLGLGELMALFALWLAPIFRRYVVN